MVDYGKLLNNLDLHGFCTRVYTYVEPVEDIVKLDAGPEVGIDGGLHKLPYCLQ